MRSKSKNPQENKQSKHPTKAKYQDYNSFYGKTMIVLTLLAVIPFLLAIYLFIYERIRVTDRIILFSALALSSILAGYSLLRKAADKLVHLAIQTSMISTENLDNYTLEIEAEKEVSEIAGHFNEILKKLQKENREIKEQSVQLMIYARDLTQSYRKTKEEEKLRARLSKYVGANLVDKLINSQGAVFSENDRKDVTILYADIRSFTTIAETMEAEDVVSMLNQFFSIMVDIIFKNNGILDKLVGDQLMAVFGLIPPIISPPYDAVKSAVEMQNAMVELMKERKKNNLVTFEIGIGINTGAAIVGNVGSENRMDYTVVGDCVNVASRFEQMARGGEIIIGEETYSQTKDHFSLRQRGEVTLRNKIQPVMCYEIVR